MCFCVDSDVLHSFPTDTPNRPHCSTRLDAKDRACDHRSSDLEKSRRLQPFVYRGTMCCSRSCCTGLQTLQIHLHYHKPQLIQQIKTCTRMLVYSFRARYGHSSGHGDSLLTQLSRQLLKDDLGHHGITLQGVSSKSIQVTRPKLLEFLEASCGFSGCVDAGAGAVANATCVPQTGVASCQPSRAFSSHLHPDNRGGWWL